MGLMSGGWEGGFIGFMIFGGGGRGRECFWSLGR